MINTNKSNAASGVVHIRPYQLLSIEDGLSDEIKFFMPALEAAGSLTVIESIMLLKLMRCVSPTHVFEFGTYKGYTTRLLLENIPERDVAGERIYTLDLPDLDNIVFQGTDKDLATESITYQRKYLSSPRKNLVKQILQDSMTLDPELYSKKFQFIFIDANHEVSYVCRDTENALVMLADAPSCVVWHDYGNPQFPELTQYLENLSARIPVYHIEDTMLAFHLLGKTVAPRRG